MKIDFRSVKRWNSSECAPCSGLIYKALWRLHTNESGSRNCFVLFCTLPIILPKIPRINMTEARIMAQLIACPLIIWPSVRGGETDAGVLRSPGQFVCDISELSFTLPTLHLTSRTVFCNVPYQWVMLSSPSSQKPFLFSILPFET